MSFQVILNPSQLISTAVKVVEDEPLGLLNAALVHAIQSADRAHLNSIMIAMCKSSPECLLEASKHLLVPSTAASTGTTADDDDDDDDDDDSESQTRTGQKRKRQKVDSDGGPKKAKARPKLTSRYETCRTCNKTFDVGANTDTSCVTHAGHRYESDRWATDFDHSDWEEEVDLEDDQDDSIESHPAYFPWDCCEKPANAPGCVVQRHKA